MDIQGQVSFLPFFHSHVCNPHMGVNRGQMVIQWAVKAQMVIQYVLESLHDNKMNLRGAAYSPSEFSCWCVRVFACLCVCVFACLWAWFVYLIVCLFVHPIPVWGFEPWLVPGTLGAFFCAQA